VKRLFMTLVVSSLLSWNAFAHSPLQVTSPNDGATLEAMPTEVTFTFKRNMRLTKVTSSHNDSETTSLDLNGQTSFATKFQIPFSGDDVGEYTIEWRGLGDDGHAQKGSFIFTVK